MVLGCVMAKRYVLSRSKNETVQKYLNLKRDNKLDDISDEEANELVELLRSLV